MEGWVSFIACGVVVGVVGVDAGFSAAAGVAGDDGSARQYRGESARSGSRHFGLPVWFGAVPACFGIMFAWTGCFLGLVASVLTWLLGCLPACCGVLLAWIG